MKPSVDVVIVGAGPYGLSLAAHLNAARVNFRIFGHPMHTWSSQMPSGMCLKSEGFASTLYGPGTGYTLKQFCKEQNLPYADMGVPVKLETFVAYGQEFQKRMVTQLEERSVAGLEQVEGGFEIQLENGETVRARKVVLAVGISHFAYLPQQLQGLPPEVVTHSSEHSSLSRFSGKQVTVLGGGASAMDLAALLHQAGAQVNVVARRSMIRFHNPPGKLPRPLRERLNAPMTGLGPGWRSLLCVKAPLLFHKMPFAFRAKVVSKHLGPAPAWFTKEVVTSHVELKLGTTVKKAEVENGRLHLHVTDRSGDHHLETDHLIAATGFRTDLARLGFLDSALRDHIRTQDGAPVLSSSFQTSLKGLYIIGAAAAPSFGPLLRFAYGAGFTARRLSRHLARLKPRPARKESAKESTLALG